MGTLDHVHIRVGNRADAMAWYAEHLGFEPVEQYRFWAEGFSGGPLQITADGGRSMLALFEVGEGHELDIQKTGVAFSVDAASFIAFARSLTNGVINGAHGRPLVADDLIDYDMCWAYDLIDPWGNLYELNSYDYDRVASDLVQADGLAPTRYWPRELFDDFERSSTK